MKKRHPDLSDLLMRRENIDRIRNGAGSYEMTRVFEEARDRYRKAGVGPEDCDHPRVLATTDGFGAICGYCHENLLG